MNRRRSIPGIAAKSVGGVGFFGDDNTYYVLYIFRGHAFRVMRDGTIDTASIDDLDVLMRFKFMTASERWRQQFHM